MLCELLEQMGYIFMGVLDRDTEILPSLLPEELALCFIMVKLCFPELWSAMIADVANWGIIGYIGRRWFRDTTTQ